MAGYAFENPLHDGLRLEPTPGPTTLVIFGASGDLTKRKLLPAVYRLSKRGRLPAQFAVVGVARTEITDDAFRDQFKESLKEFAGGDASWDGVAESLASRMIYVAGEMDDPGLYQQLTARLAEIDGAEGVLFYLAIPPAIYATVIEKLGESGLAQPPERGWRRVIVEKPFGTDLATARDLNHVAHRHFHEDQVYRIDHYLGKETVQNLLVFRFGNGMFEPVWNRRYIDHVQITAAETVGVEHRASYYESAGALRDMLQNHLMQLLTLVAMEPPIAFTAESVRDRKLDALLAVQPLVSDDPRSLERNVVRAQYRQGWVNGQEVPGYLAERAVNPSSTTETFVAVRLNLDSWRWAGVPFYIRTGKRLPKRTTEIAIQFRRPPLEIFRRAGQTSVAPDLLVVNIQPDEGISLRFEAKLPGSRMQIAPVMMNFRYGTTFGGEVPEAYETLLLDAMLGDTTLFARHDFVETSWTLLTPVLDAWRQRGAETLPTYEAGEWGPVEAEDLTTSDHRRWRTL
ncbi:MAG TPA: glucose-6-phosphate dehydrogenase [Vicinamibacterales bacterium]|nr:glucose-6-phosphate dehydrogenase [Vicinamibacterales bacterium]